DLLEVVQDEEGRTARGEGDHAFEQRLVAGLAHAERLRDRGNDAVRITDRTELDEPDGLEGAGDAPADLDRQPRLPRATGTGQRHRADVGPAQQGAGGSRLSLAPDEGGRRRGKNGRAGMPFLVGAERPGTGLRWG